ncbi:MAG TPA: M48 family metalloprotease [Terriglobia bacterium]|nr:M48 family metalloprotease [Terriglobia bacterium]
MKRWIALCLIILLAAGAVVLSQKQKGDAPVTPAGLLRWVADAEREFTRVPASVVRLTDEREIQIGDRLAAEYSARFGPKGPGDTIMAADVQKVGLRLSAYAHRKLPYRFHYVSDNDFINSFALPGGHVFIGRGLMLLMDSEDELAAVLGHEIEHIDHYHCAERAQTQEALGKIPLGGLIGIPIEVFEAGYSKDQELEADREGTRLAVRAGYSPLGAIRMFETFDGLEHAPAGRPQSPQQELSRVAEQTLQGYFRSHPAPSERIAQIKRMIAEENWTNLPAQRALPHR